MISLTVIYTAQLKKAASKASERFSFATPCTLDDVVRRVIEEHGEDISGLLLDETQKPHPSILIFVGENQVPTGSSLLLEDGESITFLSPISGG